MSRLQGSLPRMLVFPVLALLLAAYVAMTEEPQTHTHSMKDKALPEHAQTATLGAGCFWCVEAVYQRVPGVLRVQPGYMGGHVESPTYEQVTRGTTGHAEVAEVVFDPEQVSYETVLEVFFQSHDPTTLNRQGADVGTQYRSAIFYHDDTQRQMAETVKARWDESGAWPDPIVTEITEASVFYPAEDYHHDFYNRNPNQSYCVYVIRPKLKKLEASGVIE